MKKTIKILMLSLLLLICSLSLASYVTRESDFIYESGIDINEDNQIIENMVFYDIPIGIAVWSSNNLIANCTFIGCSDEGILLIGSNNVIDNCVFYGCVDGIELQKSSDNTIINCRFLNNTHAGIDAIRENNNNNNFISCLFYGNPYGCFFKESENNRFIDCNFMYNKRNIRNV